MEFKLIYASLQHAFHVDSEKSQDTLVAFSGLVIVCIFNFNFVETQLCTDWTPWHASVGKASACL